MPGRAKGSEVVSGPGPGAYTLEVQRARHAVTLKSRHYDKPDAFAPGPGAYNSDAGSTIGSGGPKASMHKKLGDYTFASSSPNTAQAQHEHRRTAGLVHWCDGQGAWRSPSACGSSTLRNLALSCLCLCSLCSQSALLGAARFCIIALLHVPIWGTQQAVLGAP